MDTWLDTVNTEMVKHSSQDKSTDQCRKAFCHVQDRQTFSPNLKTTSYGKITSS